MFDLAGGMIARGIEVDLVVNRLEFSPMLHELPKDVCLVNLGCSTFAARLPRLIRYLRNRQPNGILSAGHYANELSVLAKLLSLQKMRVVVSEHTSLSTELNALPGNSLRRFAVPWLDRVIYPFADGVVAVSEAVRWDSEKLFRLRPGTCQTIYNPVDFERIRRLGMDTIDHPWFQLGKPPVVLGIGRLEEQKDFTNLLEAFSTVRAQRDARLVIFGEGSQRQRLIERIAQLGINDCVWLAGFIPNPYPYIKRASVLALSSRWEGLPTVLMESLALGVPIVSTDCPGGSNEILAGGKFGTLVPMSDPAALAEAIIVTLGKGKPVLVEEEALIKYKIDRVLDEYLRILQN
jgi:glycosyltransferase involved in cell wall biosynthesis